MRRGSSGQPCTLLSQFHQENLVSPTRLQHVLVGAEKLPERVALALEDRFGIRPLVGYGCTECSPVVSVNTRLLDHYLSIVAVQQNRWRDGAACGGGREATRTCGYDGVVLRRHSHATFEKGRATPQRASSEIEGSHAFNETFRLWPASMV